MTPGQHLRAGASYDRSVDNDFPIVGRRIATLSFSEVVPYLVLHLPGWTARDSEAGQNYVLQIDGPVRLIASGQSSVVDLEEGPSCRLVTLLGKSIASAGAFEDGSLRIDFADGDALVVDPSVYEPWQLSGEDGSSVVSVAGGGLAVWGPR